MFISFWRGEGLLDPLFSRIRDHNFWIRRIKFGLDTNFRCEPSISSFWRGGAWAWSILCFLGFETTIFEFAVPNLVLVPIFVAIWPFFDFEGVGWGGLGSRPSPPVLVGVTSSWMTSIERYWSNLHIPLFSLSVHCFLLSWQNVSSGCQRGVINAPFLTTTF